MKKISAFLCVAMFVITALCLSACGRDEAKITGIHAGVTAVGGDGYNSQYADESTLIENDYRLQVGGKYDLTVEYTAYGGSKYPGFSSSEGVKLIFDDGTFEINSPASERFEQCLRYELICLKPCFNSVIIIEADGKYTATVIISAN